LEKIISNLNTLQPSPVGPELVFLLGKDADTDEMKYLFTSIQPQFGEKYVPCFGTMSKQQKEAVAQANIAQVEYTPYRSSDFYLNINEQQAAYPGGIVNKIVSNFESQDGNAIKAIRQALETPNSALLIAIRNYESSPKPAKDRSESIVWEVFYNLILNAYSQAGDLGEKEMTDLEHAFAQTAPRIASRLTVRWRMNAQYGKKQDDKKRTLPLPRCVYLGKHALTGRIVELWKKMGYAAPQYEAERDQMLRRLFNSFAVAA
jgi:hypothetical protein